MNKENIVGFRVSLYECDNLQSLWKEIKPENCIKDAWIPQTLGDQIWMWFEFKDKEDKEKYIKKVENIQVKAVWNEQPEYTPLKDMFMHNEDWLTQEEINNWVK